MSLQKTFIFPLLLLTWSALVSSQQCYYPNGDPAPNDSPCRPDDEVSACCGEQEICMSNGLCLSVQEGWAGWIGRLSCTDQGWGDGCPEQCIESSQNTYIEVLKCSWEGDYVCAYHTGQCQSSDELIAIGGFSVRPQRAQLEALMSSVGITDDSSTSSATQTAATTVTTVTAPAGNAATTNDGALDIEHGNDSGYSAGEMAGVGAGIGVPLLLASAGLLLLLLRERAKSRYLAKGSSEISPGVEITSAFRGQ